MLYLLFLFLAVGYNWRKFGKERYAFISSLIEAKNNSHREMILSHHFYVLIFEVFLSLIVAHIISERALVVGILGLGTLYLVLLLLGYFAYQFFLRFVEKQTDLELRESFNQHLIKELRVSVGIILMPILIYSIINWAFLDGVYEDWGSLWFIGLFFNIIFVSVLTIACTVIIMLRLIPNREITEPEYLAIIDRHLAKIGMPHLRVRWIESDMKNAFVVGLKLLRFSNQTMFIGRSLRTTLSAEEFEAVIAHELAHVANRHIHKRIIDLLKNLISMTVGAGIVMVLCMAISTLYWGEDSHLHVATSAYFFIGGLVSWILFNYALLFDTIRSHEYEADAYAVLNLGASPSALLSALEKLSTPNEMPEYLTSRQRKSGEKNFFFKWVNKIFSTHPTLEERKISLYFKIHSGLPFNYYVSNAQKIKVKLSKFLQWKISVPMASLFMLFCAFNVVRFQQGQELVTFIQKSNPEMIKKNLEIREKINSKPSIIGKSLMYYIVKKNDHGLIEYFLKNGADKGRALVYISESKDFSTFSKFYPQFQNELSEDEYFSVLRKTATLNFTEGYRLLVNAKQFEDLDSEYKADIARINYRSTKDRKPASTKGKLK